MHGSLDPEENVMSDLIVDPHNNSIVFPEWLLEMMGKVGDLEWCKGDHITVEIGGMSVCGLDGDGSKWSPSKGTRKYNKDAFIVIKNQSRRDLSVSQSPIVIFEDNENSDNH